MTALSGHFLQYTNHKFYIWHYRVILIAVDELQSHIKNPYEYILHLND
jgi:hypothetical protein